MNNAIRDWFDWRGWTIAGTGVAIALGLLAILWPAFRAFIASEVTAAWAAAIATFLAAGIALWIALWRQQSEAHRGRLEGAFALARLNNLMGNLLTMLYRARQHITDSNDNLAAQRAKFQYVRAQMEALPVNTISLYDAKIALAITAAIDQLHAIEALIRLEPERMAPHVTRSITTVADYINSVGIAANQAEGFLRRQS